MLIEKAHNTQNVLLDEVQSVCSAYTVHLQRLCSVASEYIICPVDTRQPILGSVLLWQYLLSKGRTTGGKLHVASTLS